MTVTITFFNINFIFNIFSWWYMDAVWTAQKPSIWWSGWLYSRDLWKEVWKPSTSGCSWTSTRISTVMLDGMASSQTDSPFQMECVRALWVPQFYFVAMWTNWSNFSVRLELAVGFLVNILEFLSMLMISFCCQQAEQAYRLWSQSVKILLLNTIFNFPQIQILKNIKPKA